jgi:glycopeptide antibiotics resistance protein
MSLFARLTTFNLCYQGGFPNKIPMTFYSKKKYRRQRKSILFAFLLCVFVILYYSWLPDPRLEKETYLPLWIRNWSNYYFNIRTAIPFLFLGFLLEAWSSIPTRFFIVQNSSPFRIRNTFIAALVVCLAEGGQFFVLNRQPDSLDIVFGILGSTCGSVIYYCIKKITNLFFSKHA